MGLKFHVTGTVEMQVSATIEADSYHEANELFDSGNYALEACDGDVTVTDGTQNSTDVETTSCPAEQKWDSMSILERASLLKENGAGDETALDTAQQDDFFNMPEEWQGYFEDED